MTARKIFFLFVTLVAADLAGGAPAENLTSLANDSWPAEAAPREIGRRMAERFVNGPHTNFNRPAPSTFITYPEVCTWYGALTFAQAAGERELTARLIRRFEPLLTPAEASLVPTQEHVDHAVFGVVPLQIYLENRDARCRRLGLAKADGQWKKSDADGLTPQTRYWIDDMFMITALQVQAARATGEAVYLDRAAREMVAYLAKLQQPNGLFFHAPEAPFYWGRGNGWVAAGLTELLRDLPAGHPRRPAVLAGYRKMMDALVAAQDARGLWHQLIDDSTSWPETSCTGMFTFALITGVKAGWLPPEKFAAPARRGWLALTGYIDAEGAMHEVCEGTNKNPDRDFYLQRRRFAGDLHGQAPALWCATALLR